MSQRWQQAGGRAKDGSAFGERINDDYYDFIPSDEELSDMEGDEQPTASAVLNVPKSWDEPDIVMSSASTHQQQPRVLTPIGTLSGHNSSSNNDRNSSFSATNNDVTAADGSVLLSRSGTGEQVHVSAEEMQEHTARKFELLAALDNAARTTSNQDGDDQNQMAFDGDAPFRFKVQSSVRQIAVVSPSTSATDEQQDPLYDEGRDDADEKWVQQNFLRHRSGQTDATLSCPCCFLPVCMECQRHVKYMNQYCSHSAINCRIKREEILTYTSGTATSGALPFQKRVNSMASATSTNTRGNFLRHDEFHPVVCSDCGTTVGVFDRHQQYHFFNVLPSSS